MKLVVQESPDKKELENPGGLEVLAKAGGTNAGLPFLAFLDAKGSLIVNSRKDGRNNVGHPFQPDEIAWFMTMLEKAAPAMEKAERQTIENWLRNQTR